MQYFKIALLSLIFLTATACAPSIENKGDEPQHELISRTPDAANGRSLFISKACVVCHSINGVGGKAAPALDAQSYLDPIDPVDFAVRMWHGAPAMVELQSLELGYTIWLEADEMVDLAAFAATIEEQKKLTLDQIPLLLQDYFLDERYWETEEWGDFLENGQEGHGEPKNPFDQP